MLPWLYGIAASGTVRTIAAKQERTQFVGELNTLIGWRVIAVAFHYCTAAVANVNTSIAAAGADSRSATEMAAVVAPDA